jgi:glutamate synthase (NADPH/NADH) large chain
MEKDNCGVGFVAQIDGVKSNSTLKIALQLLKNPRHRGAVGADPDSGGRFRNHAADTS